ncbi:MAG: hypothetical protein AAGG07_05680 [Planctomycetota bacterium]
MPSQPLTWKSLFDRIERLQASGTPMSDAISDLSNGEPTLFFESHILDELSQWIVDAHWLGVHERRDTVVADLAEAVKSWTRSDGANTLYDAADGLSLSNFREIEQTCIYERDDLDRLQLVDVEEYADPIDARFRFAALIDELRSVALFAASLGPVEPDKAKDAWSVEETAAWIRVTVRTLENRLSRIRSEVGELPPFVSKSRPPKFDVPAMLQIGAIHVDEMLTPPSRAAAGPRGHA